MIMKEISLHILDIAENSIAAGAKNVTITIEVNHARDIMRATVEDDGCGMDEEQARRVLSPFATSRTTRKVGLGIPFFKEGAEGCGGDFALTSEKGVGTKISASYRISHIDRPPLGDMAETMLSVACCNPDVDFIYQYRVDGREFLFNTKEIRATLGPDIPLNLPQVAAWMKDYLNEGIRELNGGV